MMRKAFEIMIKDYITVDAFWGMRRVQDIAEKTDTDCFLLLITGKLLVS